MGEFVIDNPSDTQINVSIWEKTYIVPANDHILATMPFGSKKLDLKVNNKTVGTFTKGMFDGESLINPTQATYIREDVFYIDDTTTYEQAKATAGVQTVPVCLDGLTYEWDNLVVYTGIYIPKDWDYGVYEESPDSVSINKGSSYTIKQELRRWDMYARAFSGSTTPCK